MRKQIPVLVIAASMLITLLALFRAAADVEKGNSAAGGRRDEPGDHHLHPERRHPARVPARVRGLAPGEIQRALRSHLERSRRHQPGGALHQVGVRRLARRHRRGPALGRRRRAVPAAGRPGPAGAGAAAGGDDGRAAGLDRGHPALRSEAPMVRHGAERLRHSLEQAAPRPAASAGAEDLGRSRRAGLLRRSRRGRPAPERHRAGHGRDHPRGVRLGQGIRDPRADRREREELLARRRRHPQAGQHGQRRRRAGD